MGYLYLLSSVCVCVFARRECGGVARCRCDVRRAVADRRLLHLRSASARPSLRLSLVRATSLQLHLPASRTGVVTAAVLRPKYLAVLAPQVGGVAQW